VNVKSLELTEHTDQTCNKSQDKNITSDSKVNVSHIKYYYIGAFNYFNFIFNTILYNIITLNYRDY